MATKWIPERRAKLAKLISRWKPWEQATGPESVEGEKKVATNAWTGGHRAQLRKLTKLVNAEVRASRELVLGAATKKWDESHLLDKLGSRVALADNAKGTQRVRQHRSRTSVWDCPAVWPFEGWPKVGAWWAGNPKKPVVALLFTGEVHAPNELNLPVP